MTTKPKTNPAIAHGDGSWGYDPTRQKITLRHVYHGQRYIERGESHDECIAHRTRRRRDIDVQLGLVGDGTLGGLIDVWLASRRFKSAQTEQTYLTSRDNMLAEFGGRETVVESITLTQVEMALLRLVDRGWKDATLAKFLGHWKQMLHFGERRSLVTPTKVAELLRAEAPPAHGSKDKKWFDLTEHNTVRRFLVANPDQGHALHLAMLGCGLRPAEALGLDWEYVNLGSKVLST